MYVAFLRGINVGGKTVKMDILKKSFEEIGFANVRTLLASGNVLFESETSDEPVLVRQIESKLREVFGFEIIVQIRTKEYLHELILANPFKEGGSVDVKLYVSFLTPNTKNVLIIPYESPDKTFSIISATKYELFSTVWFLLLTGYAIFEIGNTMFSSRKDMEGALELLIGLFLLVLILYFTGLRLPAIDPNVLFDQPLIKQIFEKGALFLLVPLGIDIIIIALLSYIQRKKRL